MSKIALNSVSKCVLTFETPVKTPKRAFYVLNGVPNVETPMDFVFSTSMMELKVPGKLLSRDDTDAD